MESGLKKFKLLLAEWGLEDFTQNFDDAEITDESYDLLDDETINALLPKFGPKLIFKQKYRKYLKESSKVSTSSDSQFDEKVSKATTESYDSGSIYTYIPDDELTQLINIPPVTPQTTSTPNTSVDQLLPSAVIEAVIIEQEDIAQDFDIRSGTSAEPSARPPQSKKPKLSSIFPLGLEAILNKYPDGKVVLLQKSKLTNQLRTKLTKVVITELFGNHAFNDIKADLLQRAALEIEELFPNETSDTYFIPYDPKNKKGPKGKLYTKYINTKSSLKLANASIEPIISDKENDRENNQVNNSLSPRKNQIQQDHLEFLKVATEPITRIFESWESSFKLRRKLYVNAPLKTIFDDFPCIKLNCGLELIETDFNQRYPEKIDSIYRNWQNVCSSVLQEIKERKINDLCVGETNDKSAQTILLLPYLFNPVTIKKSRKGNAWRPSRTEVQESFFFHLMDLNELEARCIRRKEKLASHSLPLQPFGVILGHLKGPKYIIIIDEVQYTVDSGVRALELLFKLFYGLDIEYPPECQHVWYFIEELVFNMPIKQSCPSTSTVVADILYHFPK